MIRQFFLSIIVTCTFCLSVLPANANDSDERKFAYPNPVERGAILTVEMPTTEHSELTVVLYNTVGKVIYNLKTTNKTVELNAPNVSGIYVLRIVEKQKVIAVEKIIVKE